MSSIRKKRPVIRRRNREYCPVVMCIFGHRVNCFLRPLGRRLLHEVDILLYRLIRARIVSGHANKLARSWSCHCGRGYIDNAISSRIEGDIRVQDHSADGIGPLTVLTVFSRVDSPGLHDRNGGRSPNLSICPMHSPDSVSRPLF